MRFDTPAGRIEFYSGRLIQFKDELPLYKPSLKVPNLPNPRHRAKWPTLKCAKWLFSICCARLRMGKVRTSHD
jgi:hypothetical protein